MIVTKFDTKQTAHKRGYDSRWSKARVTYLRANPLCAECIKVNRLTAATVIDHIMPHKGDQGMFWDHDNWQPLCRQCHNQKTAREDGGFGNKGKGRARADCGADGVPVDASHHWRRG
jgi:5-methylcytosine-specific restriction protein A